MLGHSLCVYEHLQALVVTHVVSHVLIHGSRVFRRQVVYAQYHCLFVQRHELSLSRISLTGHTRRQNIVNRLLVVILLDVHGLYIQHRTRIDIRSQRIQVLCVRPPFATNQRHRRKTQVRLVLAVSHVQTHEPNRLEVTDITDLADIRAVAAKRNLKLIPRHFHFFAVTQGHFGDFALGYMLLADLHHVGSENDFVLVVPLDLVERIIVVDIFDIG